MNINRDILQFIKSYSSDTNHVNRLIVTSFCKINNIIVENNLLINSIIIKEKDSVEVVKLEEFISLYNRNEKVFDFEKLIELFEFVISPLDKTINGAVYTPKLIREFILNWNLNNEINSNSTVCDIACGCGGFLYNFALILHDKGKRFKDIFKDNIFGIDITDYSIERTKILLSLLAISKLEDEESFEFNFFVNNSLSFDWYNNSQKIKDSKGFDYIVGNPPYVGSANIDENTRLLLNDWKVTKTGKADLYIPFFEIGLKWLKENGTLGYITVNSFYKSLNGRALRDFFSENQFRFKLIDFGSEQIFKNRTTYTCVCIIKKEKEEIHYAKSLSKNLFQLKNSDFINIQYKQLNNKEGWLLDSYETQLNIKRIESVGRKLGELFDIKNGFATLRNKVYLIKPFKESEDYYFFEKDKKIFKVEKEICRDAIKPNVLKSENEIEDIKEKLIFPYNISLEKNLFGKNITSIKVISNDIMVAKYPYTIKYLEEFRNELSMRDRGKRSYPAWFAFGRTQALNIKGKKLMFPYISDKPYFVFTDDENLMFYNGYAIISEFESELKFVQKILKSDVFWYYITNTSKPYSGSYFALAKNYIKNFGIPNFSENEKREFMKLKSEKKINEFLNLKYNINI